MTNISPATLKETHKNSLLHHFCTLFTGEKGHVAFSEFFTEAEQLMFLKRLGVIVLVHEGYSMYRISKLLGVSNSTVMVHRDAYKRGRYASVLKVCRSKTFDHEAFWSLLGVIARGGLPPRTGKRWSHVLH